MGHKLNNWACALPLSNSKILKRNVCFFVVPGNSQALLGIPDMAVLNIINLNIDSIQKEIREYKTNRGQETYADTEDCTNKAAYSTAKQDGNGQQHQANKLINYFYSSNNTDTDKSKTNAMTQRIHEMYGEVFNGIGCFEGTFSLQLKLDSKPYQVLFTAQAGQQAISSAPKVHSICPTETAQGGTSATTRIGHHNTTGSR